MMRAPILKSFSRNRELALRGDWDAARSHFEKAEHSRRPVLGALLAGPRGLTARAPRAEAGPRRLTTCIVQQSSYPWLYLLRGYANGQMGWALSTASRKTARTNTATLSVEATERFDDAEADFRRALELGLSGELQYALFMHRGVMRYLQQRDAEAANDLQQAIARDRTRYHAYASLAPVLRRLGRREEAVAGLSRGDPTGAATAALSSRRAHRPSRSRRPAGGRGGTRPGRSPGVGAARTFGKPRLGVGPRVPGSSLAAAGPARRRAAAAEAALTVAPDLADAHLLRVRALLELMRYEPLISACDAALARQVPSAESAPAPRPRPAQPQALPGSHRRFQPGPDPGLRRLDGRPPRSRLGLPARQGARTGPRRLRHGHPARPTDPDGYAGRAARLVALGATRNSARTRSSRSASRRRRSGCSTWSPRPTPRPLSESSPATGPRRPSLATMRTAPQSLLEQALKLVPEKDRSDFWEDTLNPDPLFAARAPLAPDQAKAPGDRAVAILSGASRRSSHGPRSVLAYGPISFPRSAWECRL